MVPWVTLPRRLAGGTVGPAVCARQPAPGTGSGRGHAWTLRARERLSGKAGGRVLHRRWGKPTVGGGSTHLLPGGRRRLAARLSTDPMQPWKCDVRAGKGGRNAPGAPRRRPAPSREPAPPQSRPAGGGRADRGSCRVIIVVIIILKI